MQTKKKRGKTVWIVAAAGVLALAVWLLSGGLRDRQPAGAQQSSDTVVTAFIGDLATSATASGEVLPGREALLSLTTPGRVTAVHVRAGDTVAAGAVLVEQDARSLALNVSAAELSLQQAETNLAALQETPAAADLAAAEAAVASAQASLDDLKAGPSDLELAQAEANLRAAEAGVWSAGADLASVRSSVSDSQIEAAQAALLSAQIAYDRAQEANQENPNINTHTAMQDAERALAAALAQLDALQAGPDEGQLGAAQGSVASASAQRDSSQASLNLLVNGASAAQTAAAESQLAQARATLAGLQTGPTAEELRAAETQVEQARLSLADAQEALAKATLRAPFDGVVTAVHVSEGELAAGPAVELVDRNSLHVVLDVDEVDVGELALGQPALVTLETWPGQEIASEILAIAPSATSAPGSALVTYQVTLALEAGELPVRVGMTANARLTVSQRQNVLLVPNEAINADRQAGTYSVTRLRGDTREEVQVSIGLHDDNNTQITDGLQEGDQLLVGNAVSTLMGSQGSGGGPFSGMRNGN